MKILTKKAFDNAVKCLCFIGAGAFILFFISTFDVFAVSWQEWVFIAFLVVITVVQWASVMVALQKNSDEIGQAHFMKPIHWALTCIPAGVLLVVLIVLYAALHSIDFFAVNAGNLLVALLVLAAGVGLCYLLDHAYVTATHKNRIETTTVKIVKKEQKSSKKDGQPSAEDQKQAKKLDPNSSVFPDLVAMDKYYLLNPYQAPDFTEVSLAGLCQGFNLYLESNGMFYTPDNIRAFVSGLACSRFMILEGLSGTGKTSLPKYFAEYTGADICFTSVQASWKDRSDVLGYYNDFVGKFKETPFLRALYEASYRKQQPCLMVMDEMNLSRIEYYFADFLSVLELDESQWKIELMPVSTEGLLPMKLDGCSVVIPKNVWFIGTANKDDSTFTITDKVYDRAVIIDFSRRNEATKLNRTIPRIKLGMDNLLNLFAVAINDENNGLSREEYRKFSELTDFALDVFDVNFGNRILNQIYRFVPVFVACGGTSAKALDLMFARKVLRKLEGRFDDGIKGNLVKLEKLILQNYSKTEFSETLETIARLKRKLL